MSLVWLIVGIVLQAMFALFQFIAVVFAGGGAVSVDGIQPWQIRILDLSIFLLPAISVVVSLLLIVLYAMHSRYFSHWWHLVPVVCFVLYMLFVFSISGKIS